MTTSVIVTTYDWPEALFLTLKSLFSQTTLPDEVIVADDGSGESTRNLIASLKSEAPFVLIHSWQEDKGFRLAMSRNRAIAKAKGDYIIVIDGDMILHKKFVEDHISNARHSFYLQGGRVLLGKKITTKLFSGTISPESLSFFSPDIHNRKNAVYSPLLSKLFLYTKRSLKAIKGCNFSLYKEDILKVNGFDNDFIGWGREDSEFVARLFNAGIEGKNLKFSAVAYHIYHLENERQSLPENERRLQKSIAGKTVQCSNGIKELL